jgi:hypothetical protein
MPWPLSAVSGGASMLSPLILCGGMFALSMAEVEPAASAADLASYEAAKQVVGRDAVAHVRLALWCEAHDLSAERTKHLALAVLRDPANAMARGLMGLVSFGGQWKRPESVAEKVKADEALSARLAEYNRRRARTPETADAQWELGLWCEQNGLDAEALAHFTAVTRLDRRARPPGSGSAVRRWAAAGSPRRRWPPRRTRPRRRKRRTSTGSRS